MFGERDTNDSSSGVALEYNSASKSFLTHTPMPRRRLFSAATAIDDHRFLVVAGGGTSTYKSCCVYDTRTKEWSDDWPDLNIGRESPTCVTTKNKVYAIGGRNSEEGGSLDSIEELDLSLRTPRWRVLPQRLQTKRSSCCAVVDPTDPNAVIVVGGVSSRGRETLTSCEIVSLEEEPNHDGHTRTIPSLMTARSKFGLVVVENRFLVAIGGENEVTYSASVEVLDLYEAPRDQQWHALPSMRMRRCRFTVSYSPRSHKIVVVGGYAEGVKLLDTAEELQVHGFDQRAPIPHEGLGQDQDGGMYNRPPYQPLGKPPPLSELPTGCLDLLTFAFDKYCVGKGSNDDLKENEQRRKGMLRPDTSTCDTDFRHSVTGHECDSSFIAAR